MLSIIMFHVLPRSEMDKTKSLKSSAHMNSLFAVLDINIYIPGIMHSTDEREKQNGITLWPSFSLSPAISTPPGQYQSIAGKRARASV